MPPSSVQRTVAQIPWRSNLALLPSPISRGRCRRPTPIGHAGVQGPVPVRLPRHRRAAHGTGARAASRGPHRALPAGDGGRIRLRRLVQQTTAEYLEERLGGHSVYAYNTETFGPDRTLGRTSEEEVVLTRYLRPALDSLNPGLPGEAVDNAIRAIVQVNDPGPGRGGQPDAGTPRRKPSASSSSGASKQLNPFSHRGWISGHANSASEPPLTRCWLCRRLLDAHALWN